MSYKLTIAPSVNKQIEHNIDYLINNLCNPDAALHLINEIEKIYKRMEDNPFQFPEAKSQNLKTLKYREAFLSEMNYMFEFRIIGDEVFIAGFFHESENYITKIKEP